MAFLPRITLVTPNLSQGHYLEQTLLSVLSQGYPNLDCIVVDRGSTDDARRLAAPAGPHPHGPGLGGLASLGCSGGSAAFEI